MKLYILLIVLVVGFTACKSSPKTEATHQTSSTKSKKIIYLVDNKAFADKIARSPEVQIIDVRTPKECTKGAIKNSVNINYHDRDFAEQINGKLDKNKPVMLYCAGGTRSAKAAKILEKQGFKEIYDLENGYGEWK